MVTNFLAVVVWIFRFGGDFTCQRYITCITRPSSRIFTLVLYMSFTGVAFILATTASASVVPAAFTAFSQWFAAQ